MTMYQGRAREYVVYLDDAGAPVTGILFSDVTVGIRKPAEVGFTEKTMTEDDWLEIGEGWYALNLSETDTNTLGPLLIKISGAGFDDGVWEEDIDPIPFGSIVSNDVCVVSGTIMDLGGDYKWQVPIIFRPVELPQSINTALLTGDPIRTVCDVFGNFYVMLLRGTKAIVEIDRTAIRHMITVPDQASANIVDLLPPLDE
jgi:hypothetical protein